MKHSIQLFLTTSLCITANMSIAMELELPQNKNTKEKNAKIIAKITCIEQPSNALYLTENIILVNGKKHCSIINLDTNTEIKRIFDHTTSWSSCIAVHPDKTKFALAAYHPSPNNNPLMLERQKITIYNAQTHQIESIVTTDQDAPTIIKMLFSKVENDTIAAYQYYSNNIKLYNYKTETTTTVTDPRIDNFCTLYEYSPDESYIIMGDQRKITCQKLNQDPHATITPPIQPTVHGGYRSYQFDQITMHPNRNVVMILSKPAFPTGDTFDILQYYDSNTLELITTKNLSIGTYNKNCTDNTFVSSSPNGTKLLIGINGTYAELKVSSKVFYKDVPKKTLIYFLCALNSINLPFNGFDGIEIPQDVTQLIKQTVYELYKRP
jgi:hypothetical protein